MPSIVSVHSFRGGTGKSNTTANLAATLAAQGRRVGVIDADIQSPGIHVIFGVAGGEITASLNDFLWHRPSALPRSRTPSTSGACEVARPSCARR